MNKSVSFVLLATMLIQSCVVYQKAPVSIDEAYNTKAVKIITKDGQAKVFENIVKEDSLYYGVLWDKHTLLSLEEIESVYLKDVDKSKKRTILTLVGISVPLLALLIGWIIVYNAAG
jgi:hypothetical protein